MQIQVYFSFNFALTDWGRGSGSDALLKNQQSFILYSPSLEL